MWIVGIQRQKPRPIVFLFDEINGAFRGPGCLVQFSRDTVFVVAQSIEITASLAHPFRIVMSFGPIIPRCVAELPIAVAVIQTWFSSLAGTLQMEFPNHPAVIPTISDEFGDEWRVILKRLVSVPAVMDAGRVHACHETRAAGSTNRALTVSMCKRHPVANE